MSSEQDRDGDISPYKLGYVTYKLLNFNEQYIDEQYIDECGEFAGCKVNVLQYQGNYRTVIISV